MVNFGVNVSSVRRCGRHRIVGASLFLPRDIVLDASARLRRTRYDAGAGEDRAQETRDGRRRRDRTVTLNVSLLSPSRTGRCPPGAARGAMTGCDQILIQQGGLPGSASSLSGPPDGGAAGLPANRSMIPGGAGLREPDGTGRVLREHPARTVCAAR